ncbi:hypothetical protein AB9P05_14990 [Roseivirga sp. BDSF3-8]|uniref:hypothetical protein n=1 Tax=Roseivirga sp. BDSF3-8 TaxID=3241598 RepID=UPI003531D86B
MYKIPAFLLIVTLFFSCESGDMNSSSEFPDLAGKWVLSDIEPANPVMESADLSDMDFKEYYEFTEEGKFKKYRTDGLSAEGTVGIKETAEGTYYVLTFNGNPDRELISTCQGENETLKIEGNELVNDGRMCDRARYSYTMVESED